jgi:hypothetical protein
VPGGWNDCRRWVCVNALSNFMNTRCFDEDPSAGAAGVADRKQEACAQQFLRQILLLGPIRVALLIALLQTPHRFRTKRQLWGYSSIPRGLRFGKESTCGTSRESSDHQLAAGGIVKIINPEIPFCVAGYNWSIADSIPEKVAWNESTWRVTTRARERS